VRQGRELSLKWVDLRHSYCVSVVCSI